MPRCALAGVGASEPAIVAIATKAANVFFALLCVHGVRPRGRRTINVAKKFPRLHVNPRAGHCIRSTECIDRAGFELLVAQPSANVSAGIFRLVARYISTARPWSR